MPLRTPQIERYSRQIIVPRVGGRAQERLLQSRLVIAGDAHDLEPALLYLVGAGVGRIELALGKDAQPAHELASAMRELNPDVTVGALSDLTDSLAQLVLAIVGSPAALATVQALTAQIPRTAWVAARTDSPARIAVLPSPSPCPRCADSDLLSPFGTRAVTASIVAMAATAEAFKLLAGYGEQPGGTLIEFDGYQSRSRAIAWDPACECGKRGNR
jgi:molybdopterin-synthase adenylyltransferase